MNRDYGLVALLHFVDLVSRRDDPRDIALRPDLAELLTRSTPGATMGGAYSERVTSL